MVTERTTPIVCNFDGAVDSRRRPNTWLVGLVPPVLSTPWWHCLCIAASDDTSPRFSMWSTMYPPDIASYDPAHFAFPTFFPTRRGRKDEIGSGKKWAVRRKTEHRPLAIIACAVSRVSRAIQRTIVRQSKKSVSWHIELGCVLRSRVMRQNIVDRTKHAATVICLTASLGLYATHVVGVATPRF